ncbi:hypothetical protein HNY73_006036 [Argiope bruennichi]|uniref:Uncharacterized protein n=1 Tax=Argiope bruennichi TaxID=94029 RepID=A0A8T0FQW9_ARGBR|nr:hypothetical protein HNY73_006036 [Argiope bruennichi]
MKSYESDGFLVLGFFFLGGVVDIRFLGVGECFGLLQALRFLDAGMKSYDRDLVEMQRMSEIIYLKT